MAELLNLRQASRLIGVSPGRLYRAISGGRLAAAPGGGPGKPTLVSREALEAFCASEGLRIPDVADDRERSERLERSEHAERSVDMFLEDALVSRVVERVVEQVVERVTERLTMVLVERLERAERSARSDRSILATPAPKAAMVQRIRAMQGEGLSLQAIANQLNAEGVPTLSGRGRWQKGTVANLLAQKGGGSYR